MVLLLLLTFCLLLLPLWESVIVLCFVVRYVSILVLQSSWWGRESWLLRLICLPGSRDGWAALPRGATGLSAVCDCGISWSYSLTILDQAFPHSKKKYQKYQTYPKIIESLQPPKNMPILYLNLNLEITLCEPPFPQKFKIWTPKNGPSLRISESIRVPSPSPMDLRPLPLPSAALLMTFPWVASWSYEPYFWLNWDKLYYPSPDWSSAFFERWTNVLSVEYTVYFHFVRYTSVSHTAKSFSWPFFVRYLSVKYALLMRFMSSSHAPRRPSSPSRRLSSLDEHLVKRNDAFFSVRSASVTIIR